MEKPPVDHLALAPIIATQSTFACLVLALAQKRSIDVEFFFSLQRTAAEALRQDRTAPALGAQAAEIMLGVEKYCRAMSFIPEGAGRA